MRVSAFEGVVHEGRIRFDEEVLLPENARVYVIVGESARPLVVHVGTPRLVHPEEAADFRKQIVEVADDAKL
jgi:hypothetical protein